MENRTRTRAYSSPDLNPIVPSSSYSSAVIDAPIIRAEDYSLEGISTNVKLLLKLIQEHNGASTNDDRKTQRIAGMMTILDDVKSRVEKSFQSKTTRKRLAELRRCNTELRPSRGVTPTPSTPTASTPRDKKLPQEAGMDEYERIRKQLSASLAARKSLEIMCSSLGKEKNIMACELSRKNSELHGMEELVNDLKAQNQTLLAKLQSNGPEHKEIKTGATIGCGGDAAVLSNQLLKSLECYRSLKKKYKGAKQESYDCHSTMDEFGVAVNDGLERIRSLRERMALNKDQTTDIEQEISALEQMFQRFHIKISKHVEKNIMCSKPGAEASASSKGYIPT
ncbi:myosin heavy chain-related [Euphorbia peplus]|nr:myosin heavy chain-related [Euphorbia peplus]